MKLTDQEFTAALKGKRSNLLNLCNRLYKLHKGPKNVRTVKGMVSVMTGKYLGQRGAWLWLLDQAEKGVLGKTEKSKARRYQHVPNATFYKSEAWRAVRFEALKASNGSCVLCGRSNRQHGVILHVDHIKPKSLFPDLALTLSNLQILCEDCNLGKSNRDDTDWRTATDIDRELDRTDWKAV